jgi:hypothetical protein
MPAQGELRSFVIEDGDRLETTDHAARLRSELVGDRFGAQLFPMGDIGGDGILDVAVSAPSRSVTPNDREVGTVYIVPITALEAGTQTLSNTQVRTITGPQSGGRMGESLTRCPDMDGDSEPELLIGVPWYDDGESNPLAGAAILVLSSDYPEVGGQGYSAAGSEIWSGPNPGARAGTSVACADLIGDETPDIIIGSPFADGEHEGEGAVFIIDGADRQPGQLDLVASRVLSGTIENDWLGWSVATGDLDSDGRIDLIAGAPGHIQSPGPDVSRPQGLALVWDGQSLSGEGSDIPRTRIQGQDDGDSIGRSITTTDIDADGDVDLLIGAPRRLVNDAYDAGSLYIYKMEPQHAALRPQVSTEDAYSVWEAGRPYYQTGGTFTVGDIDGDGASDLILVHRRQPG